MPGNMNYFEATRNGQYFPRVQSLVDGNRIQSLVGMEEQVTQDSPQRTRCRRHRPKRTSTLGDRNIERVHVGPRTGLPHDRSTAADMIRVTVSENQVPELVWRAAKRAYRREDGCFLIWVTGVDQGQPVVALDQEGVCEPHRDDVHTFDHLLHSLIKTPH